jgi:hypothetical protein
MTFAVALALSKSPESSVLDMDHLSQAIQGPGPQYVWISYLPGAEYSSNWVGWIVGLANLL